jgi:3-hydroxyisobutyrate dehydrogenase
MPKRRYGFVGLGAMGRPMAARLAAAGFAPLVYDKAGTAARVPPGAEAAADLAAVARGADAVFLSLPDGAAVLAVIAGLARTRPRRVRVVIDLSTIGPGLAVRAALRARAAGMDYLDAPVSGGVSGAAAGTLAVMAAGPAALVARHRAAFATLARQVFRVGPAPGQGQAMKLANNFLSASATAATAEALLYARAAGIDGRTALSVINASTGRSYASEDKFPKRVLTGTFDSGFAAALMAKDVALYRRHVAAAGTAGTLAAAQDRLWRALAKARPGADHTRIAEFLDRPPARRRKRPAP